MLSVVNADGTTGTGSLIDDIVREGARRMLAAALEAEVNSCMDELSDQRDEHGRRLVVSNGHHQAGNVTTAAGAVEVKAPRVNDKRVDETTGERKRFSSAILPPWCRKSPKVSEVLPLLHLHGLSSGDFVPALEQFLGSTAGLSPATVTRLTQQWQADHVAFGKPDPSTKTYGAKFPRAVKKITDDVDELLAFYDFPAVHWIHLRTTNPIESAFATVRLRTKVTRGAGSPAAALALVFKLVESAQQRWQAVNAPHLVALVRAGARFERGLLVERPKAA
ncbi:transposase [Streptomyces sp. NBC_01235]|uniref:transposase n=1 Tax=Streptomyces sp. NBC_01235 TaxID=2903788 RepID=UPI002E103987|nr:transposase [Streptomyces sp. NBC_01235]